ncbi:thioredoxin-like protein, partial [Fragilariopsis cylindrus CCMP1102]
MEKSSSSIHNIGRNNKPTVIDFWAPWCENCRYSAPTLYQVEELYKDQVNFVMVNADDPKSWPLIEKLGVDAIPHLSLLEADGTVDTALIGPVPKQWLIQDIDVLL